MDRTPEKQNLVFLFLLILCTFGIYYLFWLYNTKEDINGAGGQIPTFWLYIIPFLNIYFLYCFAYEFVKIIRKHACHKCTVIYFLIALIVPIIFPFVIQYQVNKYVDAHTL
jgi:magnesium-transporting ATPase (P-type)